MGHSSPYPHYNPFSYVGLDALLVLEIIHQLLKGIFLAGLLECDCFLRACGAQM